jgi:two-component system, NarL family, response regulator NreC
MSVVRILLVDDNESWRKFASFMLRQEALFEIVGEVADGLQAVTMAQQLKPTVVLMDIGLPGLNGIEAGKRIRAQVPKAKIIFVSAESDPDVIGAALSIKASGYILKSDAGRKLVIGINSVVQSCKVRGSGSICSG